MNQMYVSLHQFVFIIELVTVVRLKGNVVMSLFILTLQITKKLTYLKIDLEMDLNE